MASSEVQRHRKEAVDCFNLAWRLLAKKHRTEKDDLSMLHLAHASRHHWGIAGSARNLAIGDWQVSRAYAAMNEGRLALRFARASLQLCERNDLDDILPTAHEAVARAYAVEGDFVKATRHLEKARRQLASPELDSADRKVYLSQIKDTEALMRSR